jgi:predicted transposase YbfD/YdcC
MGALRSAQHRCQPRSTGFEKQHPRPSLKAVGKVVRMRETKEKTTTETAYSLLSAALTPECFNEVALQRWGVEKSLDWRLDVVMNEDQVGREWDTGPRTSPYCVPWQSTPSRKKRLQGSLRGKFKRASWDEVYLSRLLTLF